MYLRLPILQATGADISDSKKIILRFCISLSSECSLRPKIGSDFEFIRREREFYLDYCKVVSICNSKTVKQTVDEIMRILCIEILNFHDFCWIIQ